MADKYLLETRQPTTLASTTGYDKNQYITVSSGLTMAFNTANSADTFVRPTQDALGKVQFEVTLTTNGGNTDLRIGLDDGKNDLSVNGFTPGFAGRRGALFYLQNAGAWQTWVDGANVGSGSTGIQAGDVFSLEYDTAAHTATLYKTRSGTTTTVGTISSIPADYTRPFIGGYQGAAPLGTYTVNFGASSFTRTLSSGYSSFDGTTGGAGTDAYLLEDGTSYFL